MNMAGPRFALWLLARSNGFGSQEALVGDLLEEIARGRSRRWAWQQLIGLAGWALVAHARHHAHVTPHLVAVVLTVVLVGGTSFASLSRVLETWLGFYLVAGIIALFADMMSRTTGSRTLQLQGDAKIRPPLARYWLGVQRN
jgi:hypothetical protein